MSRENVGALVARIEAGEFGAEALPAAPAAADIIGLGQKAGLDFSSDDLGAFLRLRIANAESLPRPWGWAIARELKLVRG
ncbi:MAG: hypothetical protein VW338_11380 [Rhodospirillaceae bacterium]